MTGAGLGAPGRDAQRRARSASLSAGVCRVATANPQPVLRETREVLSRFVYTTAAQTREHRHAFVVRPRERFVTLSSETVLESVASGARVGGHADELGTSFPEALCERVVLGLGAGRHNLLVLDVLAGESSSVVG